MEKLFLTVINSSITAGWLVLALLLLRPFLKKAPKVLTVSLWALVGLRLLFPFSIESIFSLIPSAQTVPQEILTSHSPVIHSGISFVNSAVNPVISQALAPTETTAPVVTLARIGLWVWLGGLCLMLVYSALSYAVLRKRVRIHLPLQKQVYVCDSVNNPFILGIIRPRIYLPSHLSEEQLSFVLSHEFAHLQRKDHWWKPLGFLLLSIHWFNPLMWIAYILLCRDIELACDEKVIRAMDSAGKKGYSEALVACSLRRHLVFACPLAFGEVAVKDRIKSVFHYKKPAFWIVLVSVVLTAALCVGFLTDPVASDKADQPTEQTNLQIITGTYEYPDSPDPLPPSIQLLEGQRFHFRYSAYSSYAAYGTYEIKDSRLILSTEDGLYTYVFDLQDEGFVFDAEGSSYIPQYKYSGASSKIESPVPDGAVFRLSSLMSFPVPSTPPMLVVACGDRAVQAWTGTYSWKITLADGTSRVTNADSSHPLACLDSLPVLPLIPSTVSAIEPYQAQLTFAQQPKSVSITRYPVLSDPTGAIEQSPVPCSNGSFGLAYGRNVYEIVATFDSAEGAGTVHYAFSTTTPAIGYITQDDFGLTMDVTLLDNNRIQVTFTHDASNATETGELLTGDVYTLQIKHNNQWVPLQDYLQNVMHYDYNPEEIVFLTIGRMLKQNGTTTMTHDLSVHGDLPAGIYQLSKSVTLTSANGQRKTAVYTAEFAIVNE